jgi:hypothetical protein
VASIFVIGMINVAAALSILKSRNGNKHIHENETGVDYRKELFLAIDNNRTKRAWFPT